MAYMCIIYYSGYIWHIFGPHMSYIWTICDIYEPHMVYMTYGSYMTYGLYLTHMNHIWFILHMDYI